MTGTLSILQSVSASRAMSDESEAEESIQYRSGNSSSETVIMVYITNVPVFLKLCTIGSSDSDGTSDSNDSVSDTSSGEMARVTGWTC